VWINLITTVHPSVHVEINLFLPSLKKNFPHFPAVTQIPFRLFYLFLLFVVLTTTTTTNPPLQFRLWNAIKANQQRERCQIDIALRPKHSG
jgi:hypothetical protein